MIPREKRCGKCRNNYRTAVSSLGERAFDPHDGKPDRLQPFCRACDWDAKHEPWRGWKKLQSDKRGIAVTITKEHYLSVIECNRCHWCKGQLRRWAGYWIDRLDNDRCYEVGNVVPSCIWCNRYKNDLPREAWQEMISSLIKRFGVGAGESRYLEWSAMGKRYASKRPDLSRLVIPESNLLLAGVA